MKTRHISYSFNMNWASIYGLDTENRKEKNTTPYAQISQPSPFHNLMPLLNVLVKFPLLSNVLWTTKNN